MYPIGTIRHLTCIVLAGLVGAALAVGAAAAPALATLPPPGPGAPARGHLPPLTPGWNKHPPLPGPVHVHAALAGGTPGWQIILITAGAALLAAVLAVIANRMRAAQRRANPRAA